ncbi:MAG: cytochrome c biogenesis protein CcsA [Acidobacteria bacterium]|nr:cytochrome c biogenesis protein CcsA [Acidobacteriota bacterium]
MKILWTMMLVGYALGVAQSIFSLTTDKRWLREIAFYGLLAAFTSHTVWLVWQGLSAKRCPIVGTQEMCAFLAFSLVLCYFIAYRWYRANALKAFILPIVFVLITIAALANSSTSNQPQDISQPLQKILFPAHAGLILLAYAAFFLSFGAGLMYIIQERELKQKRFGKIFYRLPSLETCDAISFKAIAAGFVLLTLGIAAGIAWSRARDGVFWHGQPLEIFVVIIWVIYLLMLQSRINAGWGGRTAALASIISFMLVIGSLIGVRYLGTLHVFG